MGIDKKYPDCKYYEINGTYAEYVFNDGNNKWDNPYSGENYYAMQPGEYLIDNNRDN